jgi:uncharacterized protein YbjT (DUF2867 family)
MRILVVGATGELGRDIVEEALAAGHSTVALVRKARAARLPARVAVAEGDVLRPSTIVSAVQGVEAVICALGTPSPRQPSTLLRTGTANLIGVMEGTGVRRLVCVTLLGTGQSRSNTSLLYRIVILRALAPMVPDKQAQEEAVRASTLDWTLVRPPRFTGGRPRGAVQVIAEGQRGHLGHVVRRDLAHFLVGS